MVQLLHVTSIYSLAIKVKLSRGRGEAAKLARRLNWRTRIFIFRNAISNGEKNKLIKANIFNIYYEKFVFYMFLMY